MSLSSSSPIDDSDASSDTGHNMLGDHVIQLGRKCDSSRNPIDLIRSNCSELDITLPVTDTNPFVQTELDSNLLSISNDCNLSTNKNNDFGLRNMEFSILKKSLEFGTKIDRPSIIPKITIKQVPKTSPENNIDQTLNSIVAPSYRQPLKITISKPNPENSHASPKIIKSSLLKDDLKTDTVPIDNKTIPNLASVTVTPLLPSSTTSTPLSSDVIIQKTFVNRNRECLSPKIIIKSIPKSPPNVPNNLNDNDMTISALKFTNNDYLSIENNDGTNCIDMLLMPAENAMSPLQSLVNHECNETTKESLKLPITLKFNKSEYSETQNFNLQQKSSAITIIESQQPHCNLTVNRKNDKYITHKADNFLLDNYSINDNNTQCINIESISIDDSSKLSNILHPLNSTSNSIIQKSNTTSTSSIPSIIEPNLSCVLPNNNIMNNDLLKNLKQNHLEDMVDVLKVIDTKENVHSHIASEITGVVVNGTHDKIDTLPVNEAEKKEDNKIDLEMNEIKTEDDSEMSYFFQTPRKRGRPRKYPIEAKIELIVDDVDKSDVKTPTQSPTSTKSRVNLSKKGRKGFQRTPKPPKKSKKVKSPIIIQPFSESSMLSNMFDDDTMNSLDSSITQPFNEDSMNSMNSMLETNSNNSNIVMKNKKTKIEHYDFSNTVVTVDQIVEYSWNNGGPYMLQEQIAQYLGVKSFKRKYPNLIRRPVDMQERDYIRDKSLVSEALCDMGLTAVLSADILDIMYTDFQDKYEEYRRHLREKQVKDFANRQKLFNASSNKLNYRDLAISSAASWNAKMQKERREKRQFYMDLQTYTIHKPGRNMYPKPKSTSSIGHYPLALVPGQFTDFYKEYTPDELNYLPINTVRYGPGFITKDMLTQQNYATSNVSTVMTNSSNNKRSISRCNSVMSIAATTTTTTIASTSTSISYKRPQSSVSSNIFSNTTTTITAVATITTSAANSDSSCSESSSSSDSDNSSDSDDDDNQSNCSSQENEVSSIAR